MICPQSQWSFEQQQIWKVMQAHWQAIAAADVSAFLSHFHARFRGIISQCSLPIDKDTLAQRAQKVVESTTTQTHQLQPWGIEVYDNCAVVQYSWHGVRFDREEVKRTNMIRATAMLVKEDGRWLIVASHKDTVG